MGMMKNRAADAEAERDYETRVQLKTLEVEERAKGEAPSLVGYAAVFNRLSEDLGGFREKIAPGAFRSAIKTSDTRALWNHDSNFVLGRKSAGTLSLREDKEGLRVEIAPPDTQWARDLMVSIDRGDVSQMSFGFVAEKDSWEEKQNQPPIRTLEKIRELPDVSPVTYPAYPDTQVAMRSLEQWRDNSQPPDADADGEPQSGELPTHKTKRRMRLELREKSIGSKKEKS